MIFRWLQRRRRRRLEAAPWPEAWEAICRRNLPAWAWLEEPEQARLRKLIQVFVAEKDWEGCAGLEIDDEIRVTIAAQACLLLLGIEHDYYRKVRSILVYPSTVYVPAQELRSGTIESDEARPIAGLAAYGGPVVLSWDAVHRGGSNPRDGYNVVFHEFAHKLDMLDGWVDGTPPLASRAQAERWARVMTREFERLKAASEREDPTLLDPYGATNPGEFFAVVTECYFERGADLSREHPELYEVLRDYYGQDPAAGIAEDPGTSP